MQHPRGGETPMKVPVAAPLLLVFALLVVVIALAS
jgi:hypothetical protein